MQKVRIRILWFHDIPKYNRHPKKKKCFKHITNVVETKRTKNNADEFISQHMIKKQKPKKKPCLQDQMILFKLVKIEKKNL